MMESKFKFNFLNIDNVNSDDKRDEHSALKRPVLFTLDTVPMMDGMEFEDVQLMDDLSLQRRKCTDLMTSNSTLSSSKSDIIPKEYEGGLKTWECSLDLIRYLHHSFPSPCTSLNILELGCGSALPSIYLMRERGASRSTFQDYNEFVLRTVTIPNIVCSIGEMPELTNLTFIHGDWHAISCDNVLKGPFDLILSSETIYHPSSYSSLCQIIHDNFVRDGVALIAAKEYYFGNTLGGCMAGFEDVAMSFGLDCERVWQSCDNGLNRIILEIQSR